MNNRVVRECESGCDYVLPDYMGDVKKLLVSRARAVPTGKFIGDESIEVSGIVEYELLYTDSEGKLTVINASSDYEESFRIESEAVSTIIDESYVVNPRVRVTGPRRISMKADVAVSILTVGEPSDAIEGDVFGTDHQPQISTRQIEYLSRRIINGEEKEYTEIVTAIAGVLCDDVEIMSAFARSEINSQRVENGEARLQGEIIVTAMLRSEDEAPYSVKKIIPFEEIIASDEITAESKLACSSRVISTKLTVSDGEDGCSVIASIISDYTIQILENKTCEIISDAFLTANYTRNSYKTDKVKSLLAILSRKIQTVSEYSREELMLGEAKEVFYSFATVRTSEMKIEDDIASVVGEITVNGVACEFNVDGSVTYIPIKLAVPFAENLSVDCSVKDVCETEHSTLVSDVLCSLEEGKLIVTVKLSVNAALMKTQDVKRLVSCQIGEDRGQDANSCTVTVYYPKRGETLFEIAKKYGVTTARIAEKNSLSESALSSADAEDSLVGIKRLLII